MPKSPSDLPESQVLPAPELEKRTRRKFNSDYKLRIINEANACKHGELGALLRREKLYSNQLSDWRREFSNHGIAGLSKSVPGPSPSKTPEQRRIEQLEKQVANLSHQLDLANDGLDLQKKTLSLLDRLRSGNTE